VVGPVRFMDLCSTFNYFESEPIAKYSGQALCGAIDVLYPRFKKQLDLRLRKAEMHRYIGSLVRMGKVENKPKATGNLTKGNIHYLLSIIPVN